MTTSNSGAGGAVDVKANEPAVKVSDYDRVQMLSLHADGTPAQTPRVEMIGDPDASLEATKEQFKQQAVSAADDLERRKQVEEASQVSDTEDPQVEALQKSHDKAAKAAESAAEKTVKALNENA